MKEAIIKELARITRLKPEEISSLLEVPKDSSLGDYAFPCFSLAGKMKKNPVIIAQELAQKINLKNTEVKQVNAYINFFISKSQLAEQTISQILKEKEKYGKIKGKGKVMVEYETPNTNKPLHIGHLRNAAIGMAISNLLEFSGNNVIKADLFNDRGVHICKTMYALKYLSKKKIPDKKPDHFIGDLYVLFNKKSKENPKLDEEVLAMLQKWEQGDKETLVLWKKIDSWATKGIMETDKTFGNKFDVYFRESEFYKKAKPVIEKAIKKGFVKETEEGFQAILEPELPNKTVLRKDGTSIYITNDIALVPHKFEKYKLDYSYWVVGNEQNLYFQQLFKIFEKIGYSWVKDCKHISYGMVNLPEGRMKSREGRVVDADDLIEEMKNLALKEIEKRHKLSKNQAESRALKIALAAIKYFLLRIDISKDMIFNPEEAISFEGETGPYIQYSHARASSIIKKSKKKTSLNFSSLEEKEFSLAKKLAIFPEIISSSSKNLNPNLIAHYAYELAQIFNEFYHECPVIGDKNESQRLALVQAFKIVIKSSLNLLGIDVMEEM